MRRLNYFLDRINSYNLSWISYKNNLHKKRPSVNFGRINMSNSLMLQSNVFYKNNFFLEVLVMNQISEKWDKNSRYWKKEI